MAGDAVSSENAPHVLSGPPTGPGSRPVDVEPFIRGAAWPGTGSISYPRAAPHDRTRLPFDTWQMASLPVGVRLEFVGEAQSVRIAYRCETNQTGYRGDGAGVMFDLWADGERVAEVPAYTGDGTVQLLLKPGASRHIVYLPEGMKPTVTAIKGLGGDLAPAPAQPRWIVYGDSVAEGWIASAPANAWPAVAGRNLSLDHLNLGYAGAARGETASAEQVADLDAAIFTVCHGTNCWSRTPHSVAQMAANTEAFIAIIRDKHPNTPIVVSSPILRPDAEDTPNRLGATLADLRAAMEEAVSRRIAAGDTRLHLVPGRDLVTEDQLGDGIHPNDEGHTAMAGAIGAAVAAAMDA